MARNRRRVARINAQKPTTHSVSPTRSNTPIQVDDTEAENVTAETCPACTDVSKETSNTFDKESWIRCDACKAWYHWRCVGNDSDVESIDKW